MVVELHHFTSSVSPPFASPSLNWRVFNEGLHCPSFLFRILFWKRILVKMFCTNWKERKTVIDSQDLKRKRFYIYLINKYIQRLKIKEEEKINILFAGCPRKAWQVGSQPAPHHHTVELVLANRFPTVQCSAVQCSAVQCSVVQCSAVQCSAMSNQNICGALRSFMKLYRLKPRGIVL